MAQEDQRLGAIHRLGATQAGFQQQEHRADRQQDGQQQVGAVFKTLGKIEQIHE
ncbi:hypothetical protein D3C87_1971260 [compost metagenome]